MGDLAVADGDVLIHPKRDASILVNGKTYRGLLRIMVDGGKLRVTNHVDLESYLKGVLRGELPRHFHPESFKGPMRCRAHLCVVSDADHAGRSHLRRVR